MMQLDYILGGVVALLILVYLFYALVRPERF
ncbi:MAG: K(+)-transporting ATPase subunit F [Methylobacterium mesophilicum]|nr:K(+)-transporting ATPase subunit F [Methylobacterium mesophilicum]